MVHCKRVQKIASIIVLKERTNGLGQTHAYSDFALHTSHSESFQNRAKEENKERVNNLQENTVSVETAKQKKYR